MSFMTPILSAFAACALAQEGARASAAPPSKISRLFIAFPPLFRGPEGRGRSSRKRSERGEPQKRRDQRGARIGAPQRVDGGLQSGLLDAPSFEQGAPRWRQGHGVRSAIGAGPGPLREAATLQLIHHR